MLPPKHLTMRGSAVLFLAAVLAGAAGGCATGLVREEAVADEREIYRLLIDVQELGPHGPILVLEDTLPDLIRGRIREIVDQNRAEGLSPGDLAAIEDLLEPGRAGARVPADLGTERRYEVGDSTSSADARDVLFVTGIGWSPERDRAVVHSDFFCEGCGWGGLTFFSRGAEGWRIEDRRWLWRS